MRGEALHGKGAGHANFALVLEGLIQEEFVFGVSFDGFVYLPRGSHPQRCRGCWRWHPG